VNAVAFLSEREQSILTGASDNTAHSVGCDDRGQAPHLQRARPRSGLSSFRTPTSVSSVAYSARREEFDPGPDRGTRTAILSEVARHKTLRVFKDTTRSCDLRPLSPTERQARADWLARRPRHPLGRCPSGSRLMTFEGNDQAGVTSIALSPGRKGCCLPAMQTAKLSRGTP